METKPFYTTSEWWLHVLYQLLLWVHVLPTGGAPAWLRTVVSAVGVVGYMVSRGVAKAGVPAGGASAGEPGLPAGVQQVFTRLESAVQPDPVPDPQPSLSVQAAPAPAPASPPPPPPAPAPVPAPAPPPEAPPAPAAAAPPPGPDAPPTPATPPPVPPAAA